LEAVQKFSDAPLTTCPECSGRLRKVFSPVGVVFKGSGFYATDNRTKGAGEAAKATGDKPSGDAAAKSDAAKKGESAKKGDAASTGASSAAKPSKQEVAVAA
jgi:putative FmdB family regulatory protein